MAPMGIHILLLFPLLLISTFHEFHIGSEATTAVPPGVQLSLFD
jgi:hypothetical protein